MNNQLVELQREIFHESQSRGWPLAKVMPWLLDRRNLQAAWQRVAAADGAKTPGVDGRTARDVAPRLDRWLGDLSARLYAGRHRPAPPRWLDVPKGNGTLATRRLGILTIEDRVVHTAVKQVLEPILDPTFSAGSFGFRPGRSVPGALAEVVRRLNGKRDDPAPFAYLCKLDVANCFDTIDHAILLDRLRTAVGDRAVLALVGELIGVGGRTSGWLFGRRQIGLVQGSGLSPLLCNYYLDAVDRRLLDLAARNGQGIFALRYADDLLILARTRRLARQAMHTVRSALARLRQRLKPGKSSIVRAGFGVRWLGVDIRPRQKNWNGHCEFTYFVPDAKVDAMLARIGEMTEPPNARIDPAAFDMGCWLGSINEQLRDWWQAYMYADNAHAVFRALDQHAFQRVSSLLWAVTGARRQALYDQYCCRLPRGFRSWEIDGTRLTVLSSLAPRKEAHLTRRPLWMGGRRSRRTTAVST